ncbi:MAG: TIGR00270 family protein [Thaumarchaeota archaeon]|nr:TIGR00270 family protein [Nitrososphaerota archaeon]
MRVCEVCGEPIRGVPQTVMIDGGKLTVCGHCSRLGTPVAAPVALPKSFPKSLATNRPRPAPRLRNPTPLLKEPELDLRPDYNLVIRQAREKLNLSQEELGRKINEKPSVIRLIETARLKPDNVLASKIKHFLKVDLLIPAEELA